MWILEERSFKLNEPYILCYSSIHIYGGQDLQHVEERFTEEALRICQYVLVEKRDANFIDLTKDSIRLLETAYYCQFIGLTKSSTYLTKNFLTNIYRSEWLVPDIKCGSYADSLWIPARFCHAANLLVITHYKPRLIRMYLSQL